MTGTIETVMATVTATAAAIMTGAATGTGTVAVVPAGAGIDRLETYTSCASSSFETNQYSFGIRRRFRFRARYPESTS